MTTPLPAKNILDGTATPNTSAFKAAMGSLRDFLADLLGTTGNPSDAVTALGAPIQSQLVSAFTTGGTSTAYTLTPTPAIAAYAAPIQFDVTFHTASGADPTLKISGLETPPNLVKENYDGTYTNIAANDIPANHTSPVRLISASQALVRNLPSLLVESAVGVGSAVSSTGTGQWFDVTSISVTKGDWDISVMGGNYANGATVTSIGMGIGTATGNSGTGAVEGDTFGYGPIPTATSNATVAMPPKRVHVAATTTYYLKCISSYSGGPPKAYGRITATRVLS